MSPFMKGVIGFIGCAGICGAAYAIGKHNGREEALKEVELEEHRRATTKKAQEPSPAPVVVQEVQIQPEEPVETPAEEPRQTTVAENVRKKHGIKNKIFGGVNVIKDLLGGNTDGKQLTMTVEDGDLVARISQKGG